MPTFIRRTVVASALGAAAVLMPAVALAQDGTTSTTQLDLGGSPSTTALDAEAPTRVDAGGGGTAAAEPATAAWGAAAAAGIAVTTAAALRARRERIAHDTH